MSATDDLVANNAAYAASFDKAGLPKPPSTKVAVLTCMDARLDVHRILGLAEGDVHVVRNGGGFATDDAIRSLAMSQRLLGTEEVMVVQHTDCGALAVGDDHFHRQLAEETGVDPPWSPEAFAGLDDAVRATVARLEQSPFLVRRDAVRGFVYDVATGRLREVG